MRGLGVRAAALAALGLVLSAFAAAAPGIDAAAIDASVRPQDDLYRHANGRWLAAASIPADRSSTGTLDALVDQTQGRLRDLIQEAAAEPGDADARKIATLFASFMDEPAVEAAGAAPLAAALQAIDAVTDVDGLVALFARFDRIGVATPIGVSIDQDARNSARWVPTLQQGGLGLPNRDYFLDAGDAKFREVRERYVDGLTRLFTLVHQSAAGADARAVLALETEIAAVQWSEVQNRDPVKTYNRVDLADLPTVATTLPWPAFVVAAGLAGRTHDVVVAQPGYFAGLAPLLTGRPLGTWKAYARGRLLFAFAPLLSRDFVDAQFAFAGTVIGGRTENRPRWERGVRLVDHSLGEALGKRYVARWFPPEAKARIEALVVNLLAAYRQSIATRDWMSPPTRREALAKLAKFTPKVGYPNRWIDYSALRIEPGDPVGNSMRANEFAWQRAVDRLGKPVDHGEWAMTPQTVNAYYDPTMNEIVFPAAFLQPPAFDPAADDALNYGGIGMVIGHEISHGFDDEGSQFDGDGNLRDWWTPRDKARFAAKTKRLVAEYAAFSPFPGYFVNGELTLGENIADNAGLEIAYKAWRLSLHGAPAPVVDGLSGEQRFFLGFAQAWRSRTREPALLAQLKSDPHSPDEFRVDGTARNHPGFYDAFGVRPGDKMYLPPSERVSIW